MPHSYEFLVRGRVQGVCFRDFTQRTARKLDVKGWCSNTAGGDVSGVAQGEPSALDKFKQELHKGPSAAKVSEVRISKEGSVDGYDFSSFEVR